MAFFLVKNLVSDSTTKKWSLAGTLNFGRYGHGAIFDGEQFLVLGGYGEVKSEYCTLQGKNVTCQSHIVDFLYWRYYPEIFLVDDTYGENCE